MTPPGVTQAPELLTDACVCYDDGTLCVCPPTEKFLRSRGAAMTAEQRQWCVAEIRAVEGWSDYQPDGDDDALKRDVLSAWRDYARDKGLLR